MLDANDLTREHLGADGMNTHWEEIRFHWRTGAGDLRLALSRPPYQSQVSMLDEQPGATSTNAAPAAAPCPICRRAAGTTTKPYIR